MKRRLGIGPCRKLAVIVFGVHLACVLLMWGTGHIPSAVEKMYSALQFYDVKSSTKPDRTGCCCVGVEDVQTSKYANSRHSQPKVCNGTFWYRSGKPRHTLFLKSFNLTFRAPSTTKEALLFYGQKMSGIFHPLQRQYLAAVLEHNSVRIYYRYSGQSHAKKFEVSGVFNTCKWHTLHIAALAGQVVATVQSYNDWKGDIDLKPSSDSLTKSVTSASSTNQGGFEVDSGLYVAGVVDRKNTLAYQDIPENMELFHGQIHSTVIVNGLEISLDDRSAVDSGIVDEAIRHYLSDILRYDISQPLDVTFPARKTDLNDPTMKQFPVVGGVSDNHVDEMRDMPSSIVAKMPERGILIYDLGLSAASIYEINTWCNVTVRSFRKDISADLVEAVFSMRWKPFILHSVMQEFGGVLYADASIRFKQSINNIPLLQEGPGFVGFGPLGTSPVGAFTHESTLKALGVARETVAKAEMVIGGIQIWLDVGSVRNVLMRQWMMCGFVKECMAPTGSAVHGCRFNETPTGRYIGCHRYDQSAISVIMLKAYHDPRAKAYLVNHPEDLNYASIERQPTKNFHWIRDIKFFLASAGMSLFKLFS